jgi:hypothetical protein
MQSENSFTSVVGASIPRSVFFIHLLCRCCGARPSWTENGGKENKRTSLSFVVMPVRQGTAELK